jgi:hypothetical protein
MSAFVTKPNTPPPAAEPPITGDGFFPAVDPAKVRSEQRVPNEVTPDRLRAAVINGMISAGRDLAVWQAAQLAAGYGTLADVPAPRIDGASINLALYFTAVGCYAKARLVDRMRDVDTTPAGDRSADRLEPTVSELRRDAIHAVRDIIGEGRTIVELI